jgi:CheY-like chemotaxis protein
MVNVENNELLKKSILVIDDSPDALLLERIVLESENFDVFTAQSGTEAFEVLSKINEPNLILLDMRMEDMTGSDFLSLLEQKRPEILKDVPIVFHTGMDKVPKSKAIGFIRKPVDVDRFISEVHRFIELGGRPPYQH